MSRAKGDEDRAVVELIFRDQYARIVVVLGAQLRDPGGAEECAQEAFLELVRHWNKLREVVTLYYFADLAVSAIAHELGISEGTVKSQLSDARHALRRMQDERPAR